MAFHHSSCTTIPYQSDEPKCLSRVPALIALTYEDDSTKSVLTKPLRNKAIRSLRTLPWRTCRPPNPFDNLNDLQIARSSGVFDRPRRQHLLNHDRQSSGKASRCRCPMVGLTPGFRISCLLQKKKAYIPDLINVSICYLRRWNC